MLMTTDTAQIRYNYTHTICGHTSSLRTGTAKLLYSNPSLYNCLKCHNCDDHFPIGKYGDFVWEGTDVRVGDS